MDKRIIITRPGGFVSIVTPSMRCIRVMGSGGRWIDEPRGFVQKQIDARIKAGHRPDAARRFVKALAFGGCTTAEAIKVIADDNCAHRGTGMELWDLSRVPRDRTYRNAWRRSPKGGSIWIDLEAAKDEHGKQLYYRYHEFREECELRLYQGHLVNEPVFDFDFETWGTSIRGAPSLEALRLIWPEWLPHRGDG